jgi:Uma2 family endonuclease
MIAQLDKQPHSPETYSPEAYLDREVKSDQRHEYRDGVIIPMTGGTPQHNRISGLFYARLLFALLNRPYEIFHTDQRLWIPERRMYTYPDVMVLPKPIELQAGRRDTVMNPLLIAEILSKSTRNYDGGEKFAAYRTIPSFQEYLLIDQYAMRVEHFTKLDDCEWRFVEYHRPESILQLKTVEVTMQLSDLYSNIDFSELDALADDELSDHPEK